MKIWNILFCVVVFLVGLWIGMFNSTVVEVVKEVEIEVKVPYLNLTAPDLKHRLEVYANILGLTFQDKKEIEYLHRENKSEIENLSHKHFQAGFQTGYVAGVQSGRAR